MNGFGRIGNGIACNLLFIQGVKQGPRKDRMKDCERKASTLLYQQICSRGLLASASASYLDRLKAAYL